MSPTVSDLRNDIRLAVGRFERAHSAAFTKESLAAICEAVGHEIDHEDFPSKDRMRAGIRYEVGVADENDPSEADRPFRKAELEAIAEALDAE